MLTIENYYEALRDSVRFYPNYSEGLKCLQPQTFSVIESKSNMSMENLGRTPCDRGKPYFFSRLWKNLKYNPSAVKFQFPLVSAMEISSQVSDLFTRNGVQCYRIELMVSDNYSENCEKGKCAGCDGRSGNEIFRDTEIILNNVLDYLINCNVVRYDGNDRVFLHPKTLSDALVANGDVTNYVIDKKASNSHEISLRQRNLESNIFRLEGKNGGGGSMNDLYGTIIVLNICMNRCISGFEPEIILADEGVVKDIGCCG